MIENKDKVLFLKMCVEYVCLSKGINSNLVLKLHKDTITCVRELLVNHLACNIKQLTPSTLHWPC